ncbi:MAG: transposase [Lachnospiraceae bacterium]|nr:transposase [Lachnospiraceae bacterium]
MSEMHNQIELNDFDQPMGIKLDHNNRWYQLAKLIPWEDYEAIYASKLSSSQTGNLAKPFRMAFGALIIQTRLGTSDRETVRQIQEYPYLQYFIGLPRFQTEAPFDPSLITLFRKRIGNAIVDQVNDDIVSKNHDLVMSEGDKLKGTGKHSHKNNGPTNPGGGSSNDAGTSSNTDDAESEAGKPSESSQSTPTSKAKPAEAVQGSGTLILDATCAPVDIRYPVDASLLNEAREKLEAIIRRVCHDNSPPMPRTYCENAHREYLNLAKSKKPGADKIRRVIRGQLQYLYRDLGYIEGLMADNRKLNEGEMR